MRLRSDVQWEAYGRLDPYYGVLSSERFKSDRLDAVSKAEFFASGEKHVDYMMQTIRAAFDAKSGPRRVLDFGCGVGRCTIPLARIADEIVAMDVSPSMLREAEKNCAERSIRHVRFVEADDKLSGVTGTFDIIHAFLVFLHIPPERGRLLLSRLLDSLGDGGIIVVDFLYQRSEHALIRTLGELRKKLPPLHYVANRLQGNPWRTPLMEKNVYSLNEYAFAAQARGCRKLHVVTLGRAPHHLALVFAQKRPLGDPYENQDFY
jgi:SAM-dependent methyltransferase